MTTNYPKMICETPDTWGPETYYIDAKILDAEIEQWEEAQGGEIEYDVDETTDWDLVNAEIGLYKQSRSRYDNYQLFAPHDIHVGYWEIRSRSYKYGNSRDFAQFFGGSKGAEGYAVRLSLEDATAKAREWLADE